MNGHKKGERALCDATRAIAFDKARAAVEAMREPTEEMIEVAQCGDINLKSIYVGMVDTALK